MMACVKCQEGIESRSLDKRKEYVCGRCVQEMTSGVEVKPSQRKTLADRTRGKVLKVVRSECCNYGAGWICASGPGPDRRCLYIHGLRCRHFEANVLPLKPDLALAYGIETGADLAGSPGATTCPRCREPFRRSSPRQKYCDRCSKIARREGVRRNVRHHRVRCNHFDFADS